MYLETWRTTIRIDLLESKYDRVSVLGEKPRISNKVSILSSKLKMPDANIALESKESRLVLINPNFPNQVPKNNSDFKPNSAVIELGGHTDSRDGPTEILLAYGKVSAVGQKPTMNNLTKLQPTSIGRVAGLIDKTAKYGESNPRIKKPIQESDLNEDKAENSDNKASLKVNFGLKKTQSCHLLRNSESDGKLKTTE